MTHYTLIDERRVMVEELTYPGRPGEKDVTFLRCIDETNDQSVSILEVIALVDNPSDKEELIEWQNQVVQMNEENAPITTERWTGNQNCNL